MLPFCTYETWNHYTNLILQQPKKEGPQGGLYYVSICLGKQKWWVGIIMGVIEQKGPTVRKGGLSRWSALVTWLVSSSAFRSTSEATPGVRMAEVEVWVLRQWLRWGPGVWESVLWRSYSQLTVFSAFSNGESFSRDQHWARRLPFKSGGRFGVGQHQPEGGWTPSLPSWALKLPASLSSWPHWHNPLQQAWELISVHPDTFL